MDSDFIYYEKNELAKKFIFANVKKFCHLIWIFFYLNSPQGLVISPR
jgi:hypothetical protein